MSAGAHDDGSVQRPYEGLEPFSGQLGSLEVRVKNQGVWTAEDAVILRNEDYLPLALHVRWELDSDQSQRLEDAVNGCNLKSAQIDVLGVLRCSQTKAMRIVYKHSLEEVLHRGGVGETLIATDERPALLPGRSAQLEFYLALAETIEGNFPYPYLKGTWLDSRNVELRSEAGNAFNFIWLPLNDEVRQMHGLHKNSVLFVNAVGEMHEQDRFSDCVEAYLDPVLEDAIKSHGKSAIGKLLQASLVKEVISSALSFSASKLQHNGAVIPWDEVSASSVLGQMCRVLSLKGSWTSDPLPPEEIYLKLQGNPAAVGEYLEDLFNLRGLAGLLNKGMGDVN
jgi:hypothetical protein